MAFPTVSAAFVKNMLQGAQDKGYDVCRLLLENGISPGIVEEPRSRVTLEQLSNLSQSIVRLLGDEAFGLMERPQRPNTFKLACYSVIHARTVGEALALFAEFFNITEIGLIHTVIREGGVTRYQLTRRSSASIRNSYAIEHLLVCQHRTLCWLANAQIPVLHAELDYPAPPHSDEYRFLFYRAPVYFGRKHCTLTFSDSAMRLQNVRDIVQLKAYLRQAPLTLLTQTVEPAKLSAQIRAWLDRGLAQHREVPALDIAATHFQHHPQAMRRLLKKEGTSYQEIKAEARRDLAITLLSDSALSIGEIAARLDYSEPRAFIRAFRGWVGMTPLTYRKLGGIGPTARGASN